MKKTYIQVKKLHDLFGDMASCNVEVHVYKKLSYILNDRIFTAVMHSKHLPLAFGDYWIYAIMPIVVDGCGAIKMLICIDRPDGEWQEI